MNKCIYLSLGSNLGDREGNLTKALALLASNDLYNFSDLKISNIYETEALTLEGSQSPKINAYLNLVIGFKSNKLDANNLLSLIQSIEKKAGRLRELETKRYQSRVLDIDILFFEELVLETKELTIPHPEIINRKFVLKPMLDIAPSLIHPVNKKTMEELEISCADKLEVKFYLSGNSFLSAVKKSFAISGA